MATNGIDVQLDTRELKRAVKKTAGKILFESGSYLMKTARNSIRKQKNPGRHSQPGQPPFYHGATFAGGVTFRRSIMFKVDKNEGNVVIGPIAGRLGAIGSLHEFGGRQTVEYIDHPNWGRIFKVGDLGPVSTKKLTNYRGSGGYKDPLTGYPVAFIEIRTRRMAEHATRLQRRLLLSDKRFHRRKTAVYPARPFMRPAYAASESYLLRMWRDAVTK